MAEMAGLAGAAKKVGKPSVEERGTVTTAATRHKGH